MQYGIREGAMFLAYSPPGTSKTRRDGFEDAIQEILGCSVWSTEAECGVPSTGRSRSTRP